MLSAGRLLHSDKLVSRHGFIVYKAVYKAIYKAVYNVTMYMSLSPLRTHSDFLLFSLFPLLSPPFAPQLQYCAFLGLLNISYVFNKKPATDLRRGRLAVVGEAGGGGAEDEEAGGAPSSIGERLRGSNSYTLLSLIDTLLDTLLDTLAAIMIR